MSLRVNDSVASLLSGLHSLGSSASQNTLLPLGVVGTEKPSQGKPAGPGKRYAPSPPANQEEEGHSDV